MSIKYNVKTEEFAEKHYIKNFRKKYKTYWDLTFKGIEKMLECLDNIMDTTIVEEINCLDDLAILKMEFRVAGTNFSKKASGNRCILSLNKKTKEIRILLVYHKGDIGDKNETATWKKIIRDNYDVYNFCR
jgi:hypothetical protein